MVWSYHKGRVQGILTLPDNSKMIIYAKNEDEVHYFFGKILSNKLINPKLIEDSELPIKVGTVIGNYKEVEVVPASAKFFSTGQKNLTPDWHLSFGN